MREVKHGAKMLDRIMPLLGVEAWWNKIEIGRLVMHSSDQCILAQLFADNPFYTSGYNYAAAYIRYAQRERNGFTTHKGEWEELKSAWVEEINARRNALVSA